MDRNDFLNQISEAWVNLHFAQYQARVARHEFLDSLLDAEDNGLTQEEMAGQCVNNEDHISRSRIAQYLGQARKNARQIH